MIRSISKPSINMKQIYSVDGNIGSGKSMILEHISSKKFQNMHCMQEPVAEWTNLKSGVDLLGSFYDDKERWSFSFENLVQLSRLKAYYQSMKLVQTQPFFQRDKKTKIFLERSIYSSFYVFTENTYNNDTNNVEFDILKEYFRFFTSDLTVNTDNEIKKNLDSFIHLPFKLIYIKSDPDICYERLKFRQRESEDSIDIDYLKSIHFKYEDWVSKLNKENVIVIDGNQSKECVLKQIDEICFN